MSNNNLTDDSLLLLGIVKSIIDIEENSDKEFFMDKNKQEGTIIVVLDKITSFYEDHSGLTCITDMYGSYTIKVKFDEFLDKYIQWKRFNLFK